MAEFHISDFALPMIDRPYFLPPLDPGYLPAALWNRAYRERCEADPGAQPLALAFVRPDGEVSRFDTRILSSGPAHAALNARYVERLVKFLLWARGGCRIIVGGPPEIAALLARTYAPGGERSFDSEFLGEKVYGHPLTVESCAFEAVPAEREGTVALGRHLEGCRIGFDLGGSDRKCAAVIDGVCVFSEEIPWDPYFQTDPQYHYDGINDSLRRAAAHLPRVDAIGGSAAGVYVNSEVRAASLFRGVSADDFARRVRGIFFELQKEWGQVPFEVANDGEVTALAGSMSSGHNGVLGVAMGTSVAAGYVTQSGAITPWLNELAFVPVDYRPDAPADEWSTDLGCAVQYFSQQGVARLAPHAGLLFPSGMRAAEQLVEVQHLMAAGDDRAARIYETLGICFGYAVAHFAEFYELQEVLVLGRVTSGGGGELLLAKSRAVLAQEFPDLADRFRLRMPNEQDKRLGQAVAAASLPMLRPAHS